MHEYLAGWILWEPIHTCALEVNGDPEQLTLHVVLAVPNEDPGEKNPSRLGSF